LIQREREQEEQRGRLEEQVQLTSDALGQTRDELRALSAHLINTQEEERRRLARDLHDDFGQRMAILEIEADQLESLLLESAKDAAARHQTGKEHASQLGGAPSAQPVWGVVRDSEASAAVLRRFLNSDDVRQALQRMRTHIHALSAGLRQASHALHPSILADLGLVPGLRNLVDEFSQSGLHVSMRAPAAVGDLASDIKMALYRITQEALRNTLKHAPHADVRVTLGSNDGQLQLNIEDSGPGFNLAQARVKGGLGLLSMQERAHMVGGILIIRTAPRTGTHIIVRVPFIAMNS
jgi:two-component system CheB/CheR fusion protein